MLKNLKIEQFVIIEKLDLDLSAGLTILTGETGAGKSILLGAMGLILGEKSNPDAVRQGSDRSLIEAHLAPPAGHPVWTFLKTHGFADETTDHFIIRRILKKAGADDITLNGKVIELEILQELGEYLIEIHGQFANQSLTEPANQLKLLDLSGNFDPAVFKNVKDALDRVEQYTKELEEEKIFLARHKKLAPQISSIVKRFEKVGMAEGFPKELKEKYDVLLEAKETCEAFQSILSRLIASDGVVMALSAANKTLADQKNIDFEKMAKLSEVLNASLVNARSAVEEMNTLSPEYEIDTKPIHECKEKLGILNGICEESKITYDDLDAHFVEMTTKLNRLKNGREKLKELEEGLSKAKGDYIRHAQILSEKRTEAGKALSASIMAELPPLKLEKAEFQVEVVENSSMDWTPLGFNEVTFTARMNPGMPFSPISDTASGGELARMMLGLKVVVQGVQATPTLVFDEVDTGIGGAAAAAVGERIAQLAENAQVLVITHSPQVASRGDQHLHVSKSTDGVTTTSKVLTLSMQERIDEISRMLAGDTLTDESQAAAKRLIDEARTAAQTRRTASG